MSTIWFKRYAEAGSEHIKNLLKSNTSTSELEVSDQNPLTVSLNFQPEGSLDYVEAGNDNGFPVNVVTSAAPELYISPYITPLYGATSGALDANDAYGSMVLAEGFPQKGRILGIQVLDRDDGIVAGTLSIHMFDGPVSASPASDAAIASAFTDSDLEKLFSVQTFGTINDMGGARFLEITDVNSDYELSDPYFRFQLSTSGTPTPTAAGMPQVKFRIQVLS